MDPITISITISGIALSVVGLWALRKLYKKIKNSTCHSETSTSVYDFSYKAKKSDSKK